MFAKLFRSSTSAESRLEHRLVEETAQLILNGAKLAPSQARDHSRNLLNLAKKALEDEKEENIYEEGIGSRFVTLAETVSEFEELLSDLAEHGVSEKDFKDWHDLSKLERRFLLVQEETLKMAMYTSLQHQGCPGAQAIILVNKAHPRYTDDTKLIDPYDSDSPLPVELKLRTDAHGMWCISNNPERFKAELDRSRTFNSWVRHEIMNKNM